MSAFAEVAQLVEHLSEEQRVGGSSPPLSTKLRKTPIGAFFCIRFCAEGRARKTSDVSRFSQSDEAASPGRKCLVEFERSSNST